jgi:hypothetical protein
LWDTSLSSRDTGIFSGSGIFPAQVWPSRFKKGFHSMRQIQQLTRLVAAAVLLLGLSPSIFAQDPADKSRDRMKNETTMTGCLNKDTSGGYMLTEEKTGAKMTVIGPADLEKHSANHRVTLTGAAKNDASGKPVFEVSKIQHMSASCKAPSQ